MKWNIPLTDTFTGQLIQLTLELSDLTLATKHRALILRNGVNLHFAGYQASFLSIGTRSSATAEITRVGGRYTVRDHSSSVMLVPVCDFILVNDTNFHPFSHRTQVTAGN